MKTAFLSIAAALLLVAASGDAFAGGNGNSTGHVMSRMATYDVTPMPAGPITTVVVNAENRGSHR